MGSVKSKTNSEGPWFGTLGVVIVDLVCIHRAEDGGGDKRGDSRVKSARAHTAHRTSHA